MPPARGPEERVRGMVPPPCVFRPSLCVGGPARISAIRLSRNPFTIEGLYMNDERLVRGQAAAQHNQLTEVPLAEAADSELLKRISMGSEGAFRMLWDRLGAGVYTVGRRRLGDASAGEDASPEDSTDAS